MSAILSRRGWAVTAATTVAEALAALSIRPDWIILDLMLPDGDGAQILRAIRLANLPIRVAVTTGTGDPQRLAEVRSLGPDALFRKPIDLPGLLASLGFTPGGL